MAPVDVAGFVDSATFLCQVVGPMATTLADADRAIAAARDAGVLLQVGFNRRFAAGFAAVRAAVDAGRIGTPQLLRSLTRARSPPTRLVFHSGRSSWRRSSTLRHAVLPQPGAAPTRVHAIADALVVPAARASGHLDTAVVTVRFDNGAIGTAEASFSAL